MRVRNISSGEVSALTIVACILGLASVSPAAAQVVKIRWATEDAGSNTNAPGNALHAPDGNDTRISDYHTVWVRTFGTVVSYAGLAGLLGVGTPVLDRADVIAFEQGGVLGRGWESSVWMFSDLRRAYAEVFDERIGTGTAPDGRAKFWGGTITESDFRSVFCTGSTICGPVHPVVGWVLIDVPNDIDPRSAGFSVWVEGTGGLGEGTPDPDAIGIFAR